MDNKAIFVRTSKGEDEAHSRTTHLAGDVKRALLMVDGVATFGEISKRAAPSLRANLESMFQELENGGFIQDRAKSHHAPRMFTPPKMSVPSKMSVPPRTATPPKNQPADDEAGELDFMAGFSSSADSRAAADAEKSKAQQEAETRAMQELEAARLKAQREAEATLLRAEQEASKLREEAARRAKAEADAAAKSKEELEAAKLKAQQEAEAILLKAGQDAEKLREAAALRAKAEEDAARLKAEQEAKKLRADLDAAKLQAEQEAKLRLEAAAKVREQAEAARIQALQEAEAIAKQELEAAKLKAQQEAEAILLKAEQEAAKLREEAARRAKAEEEAARLKAEQEAKKLRDELEAEKLKAEQVAKLRLEAARKVAEQEAAQMRAELEAAKARAELEAKARLDAAAKAHARMKAEEEAARIAQEREAARSREAAEQAAQQPASQPAAASGATPDFAFDAFQVDQPQPAIFQATPEQVPPPVEAHPPAVESHSTAERETGHAPQPGINPSAEAPQHSAPPPSVAGTAESQPDQEQLKLAEQERIAAEAQAKKLADEQARVWAEAEQRALAAAKANAEKALHQTERPVAEKAPAPPRVARARKPFPWGKLVGFMFKLGIFLLVLLVGALFAAPYFLPMRDYMPKVEQLLSHSLNQPVHIGYLSGRILPTPRLELGEIYIGEVKQFQAAQAQLNFAVMGLFDEKKPITSVVLQNVKVSGKGLQNAAAWLQKLAANGQYPVSRMVISQGTLDADVFELTGIEGELNFSPNGKFTQANMRANSGKYILNMNATPEDKLQVAISVRGSALPLLPNWVFDDLTAQGELNHNELKISDYDARILGGVLQGNASVNWRSGWQAQGTITAKTVTMNRLNSLLDGNVDGLARFKMTSPDLAGLADSAMLDGNFTASEGTINGMDIAETARLKSKAHLPGGRTHFKEFSGAISFANNAYHFKQMKITTDVLNASAALDIEKRQLSGSINARLSIQQGMEPVDLQIGGTIDSPQLRVVR